MKLKLGDWQTSKTIKVDRINGSTYSTVQDFINLSQSAGRITGGEITEHDATHINIASGTGWIRIADDTSTLKFFDWEGVEELSIGEDSTNQIYVDYNSGNPIILNDTENTRLDLDTQFPLGTVVRDNNHLHIINNPYWVSDSLTNIIQRFEGTQGVVRRDQIVGGLILGETGTRNVTVSAGRTWSRLNDYDIEAIDTSDSDTFDAYYSDGSGGWNVSHLETQWDNLQYDDGSGTLATLGNNQYGVLWWYIETDGDLVCIYGVDEYSNVAGAEAEPVPTQLPQRIQQHGLFIGRFIFQKSAATTTSISSAFDIQLSFSGGGTSVHNDLSGLQGGTAGEYYHLTAARHTDLTDGGDSTLHYHATDRARANHTGTQTASTISDFDTEVSNNTDVSANTSARHDAVTLGTNTASALSLSGQQLSIGDVFIQLSGDEMSGKLSFVNSSLGDNRILEITSAKFQPTGPLFPVNFVPIFEPAADISNLYGSVNALSLEQSSFNVTNAIGSQYQVKVQTGYTGTLTSAIGLQIINPNKVEASATVENVIGLDILDLTTGSVTNKAIQTNISSGSGKHNLYISGTADNYFAGNIGIGVTSPTRLIDLKEIRTSNTSNQLANFRQVWSPTTTSGAQFPTVFQLLPEYNSTHTPASGFLTGLRTFAYVRDTGVIAVRNCDIYTANSGNGTVPTISDVVIRGVGNTASGAITTYTALTIQSSTAAGTNNGLLQQGAGMINYFQGPTLFGATGTARTSLSVSDDLTPYTNNTYDLGNSTYKWNDVWATNATIQTSDLKDKRDIKDSQLGLDFINALRPVEYKWKDYTETYEQEVVIGYDENNEEIKTVETIETTFVHTRPHYGLIAQEVKAELDNLGIDFAGYIENESGLGLRYTEFIAPLIKSIQELTVRVEALEGQV